VNKRLYACRGYLCVAAKGVQNVNVEKNASTPANSSLPIEPSGLEETNFQYTSDGYQKILDYHVGDILLTTIIFGIILLVRFRLHH
jgi:hypothetical protein